MIPPDAARGDRRFEPPARDLSWFPWRIRALEVTLPRELDTPRRKGP
jgi:hypothetical protein